jgi:DNA-binding transcriptional regulator/RsmH inhibitor MraZ
MASSGIITKVVAPPSGAHKCKVDDRGRLKLPAEVHRYFKLLEENIAYVTTTDEKVVRIYRLEDWRDQLVKLGTHANPKAAELMLFRTSYYGEECPIDPQGRIPLPDELRQALSLDNQDTKVLHFKSHFNVYTLRAAEDRLKEARAANLDEVDWILD